MSFRVWALLLVWLAVGAEAAPWKSAREDEIEKDLDDSFARVTMIVEGLASLSTAPEPYALPAADGGGSSRPKPKAAIKAPPPKQSLPPTPAWIGRHLGPIERQTVFAVFQVTVDETSPTSFDVSVISSAFCEEVVVKDRRSQKVLATQSKDDEKLFRVSVFGHPLDESVELSIAVLDPNDANSLHYAAVPLLGGTGLELTP
jgi:hypothetical protein